MAHISPLPPGVKAARKDARVERTRRALHEALLALLDEQPFDQITIRDISARARAGYATFFRHYPDKTTLLNELAAESIRELLERALPILEAVDTRASCHALCRYVDGRRQLWSVLLTGGAAASLREEFIRQARSIATPRERPESSVPSELAVVFGVSGTLEILTWWLQNRKRCSVEQIAEILDMLVIAPILRA